ncbi:hypothetical protein [Tumebacillus algifaecis]|uniref:hypothetical protein n=1 Tax=Tumebacillus algifaecis TaxID=1214604 RepID=UPI0012FD9530|nr:hypothetical protein [Tumebacillus algifaecis]
MALDEPNARDTRVEEAGILFLFGAKTSSLIQDLVIDYDDEDGFSIYDESIPSSQC